LGSESRAAPSPACAAFGKLLGLLDRGGADQHRLAALLAIFDQRDDRAVFLAAVR
jgi:hypothetical protein